jgi:hypothetical protein
VNLPHLVDLAGVKEHALRGRRLARVDVGDDSDVPVALEGVWACHDLTYAITSDSGRRPCWPPPSCGCLPSS